MLSKNLSRMNKTSASMRSLKKDQLKIFLVLYVFSMKGAQPLKLNKLTLKST